jgi:hypothetical protein
LKQRPQFPNIAHIVQVEYLFDELTQEFLAMMLGVQCTGVSATANSPHNRARHS